MFRFVISSWFVCLQAKDHSVRSKFLGLQTCDSLWLLQFVGLLTASRHQTRPFLISHITSEPYHINPPLLNIRHPQAHPSNHNRCNVSIHLTDVLVIIQWRNCMKTFPQCITPLLYSVICVVCEWRYFTYSSTPNVQHLSHIVLDLI